MRARTRSATTRQPGQFWFFWDRFWGRNNRLCCAHCDRDRKRRIASHRVAEGPPDGATQIGDPVSLA